MQKDATRHKIIEYNKTPNICKNCKGLIYAPYDKPLRDTKVKIFCSRSCSAKYNNLGTIRNKNGSGLQYGKNKFEEFSDEQILMAFNNSVNLKEFSMKFGYKDKIKYNSNNVNNRLKSIGISLDKFKQNKITKSTKDDLFKNRANWQSARSSIQKTARKIYEKSDKDKQCIICGYKKHYEIAHIKSVSSFNNDATVEEINDILNLVALCPNHHWEFDNGKLLKDELLLIYNN